VALKNRRRNH